MMYVEWAYLQIYNVEKANNEKNGVLEELETLYEKFVVKNKQAIGSAKTICNTSTSMPLMDCEFQSFLSATSSTPSKSELRNYLDDLNVPLTDPAFNLLEWRRVNAPRYPMLAMMAKRFLTIPATSVSSESTFSTGGRVLDGYRSSLKPEMVEALVCGATYIKGAHKDFNVVERDEDEDEDVENIELPNNVDVGDNNNW